MGLVSRAAEDKPSNGVAGLKHWRHDWTAGLVVSLVSLPLSSGIAIASGAPPVYGIVSSIIAGLVFPFIGGSYVTISGPAAGLAPALLATMAALGGAGDADHVGAGYPLLLVVIFFAGVVQVTMAKLKLARYASIFPSSVVEGMLGAIGILILVKALPMFVGCLEPIHGHGFAAYVQEIPHVVGQGNGVVALIGVVGLVAMLGASSRWAQQIRLLRVVPPHIWAVLLGVGMALAFGVSGLDPRFLIEVPSNPLDALSVPAFGDLWAQPDLWHAAFVGLVTLTLIDGVESLATAQAVDHIDPHKRRSKPDRVLFAMGLSNMLSSLIGGLTVIPGGVKSKTCVEAGGRTLWANFANATFLLGFLFVAPTLLGLIPKATLGAILIYTGWKMIHPSIARHLARIGWEQLVLYAVTIVVTLATDLLVGVLVGTAVKLVFLAWVSFDARRRAQRPHDLRTVLTDLFRDPVTRVEERGDELVLHVTRPLVCFNGYRLFERVDGIASSVTAVVLEIAPQSTVVDHTASENLLETVDAHGERTTLLRGLDQMQLVTRDPTCIHIQQPRRMDDVPDDVAA